MLIYFALFTYLFIIGYLFIGLNKKVENISSEPFISIIIVTRNEQENITDCLKSLDKQNYENYELIFVDDNSTDSTLYTVTQLSIQAELTILKGENQLNFKSSKKGCLELGRQNAKGDLLLFTDADCRPNPDWVKTMVSAFGDKIGLVAGFSPQTTKTKKLWSGFLKTDSMAAAIVSAGGIGWNHGITCTGRNLAVRAAALEDIGGYAATKDSLSGDDDFLLAEIANHPRWNVAYVTEPKAVVPANGPSNFQAFLRQKQRHISAGKKFDFKSQIGYSFYHGANYFLWLYFIINPVDGLFPLIFKLAADGFLIRKFSPTIGEKLNLLSFFVWEILFPVYHILSAPVAFWGKVKWR